jgi:hypothetical protein
VFHRFADLVLESDVPFSELPSTRPCLAECSVRLDLSERSSPASDRWDHHWRSPKGEVVLSCSRDGDSYRLGMSELATFLIDGGGRTITCRPEEALPSATLEHLLIDQVLPRVLTHRGRLVIHAGCVGTPHGAVAFLGDSGAGKSTLCAEFARAGYPLLGDDGIVIRPAENGGIDALATYPGLRLHPDPLAILFDDRTPAAPVAHYSDKRRLDRNDARLQVATGAQPLVGVYVLDTAAAVGIASIAHRDAFMALLGASFQLHLDDPERSRELFWRVGALLDAVPVRRLSFPRDFTRLPAVRDAVLEDAGRLATPASSAGCACS